MSASTTDQSIALLPLDARPVCYDFPKQLAAACGIHLQLPAKNILGRLKQKGNLKKLDAWIEKQANLNNALIAALDTVAYGGLISSRVGDEPLATLQERVRQFFETTQHRSLFGFSSILRIPNYNNDEEEPDYWATHGAALYRFSVSGEPGNLPKAVLTDFLARRERNFKLNLGYVDALNNAQLDYLVYCQDDTGPQGLNVDEAATLMGLITQNNLQQTAHLQTGADEVAACLLARWLSLQATDPIGVFVEYSAAEGADVVAKFDGIPIAQIVQRAVQACGAMLVDEEEDADLHLVVHTPGPVQGDHCENQAAQIDDLQRKRVLMALVDASHLNKPITLADVSYANGADDDLTTALMEKFSDLTFLYGYAAWNTPGNSIGSAVAMGVLRLLAERAGRFSPQLFNPVLLTRLADDWLYQSDVRQQLRTEQKNGTLPSVDQLNQKMSSGLRQIQSRLNLSEKIIQCGFPCDRTFEVDIMIEDGQ